VITSSIHATQAHTYMTYERPYIIRSILCKCKNYGSLAIFLHVLLVIWKENGREASLMDRPHAQVSGQACNTLK
jgi:hypothetical protein